MNWRNRDNAPVPETCPMIDSAISCVEDLYQKPEFYTQTDYDYFIKTMENIRQANQSLRKWGNEEYMRANELEKELDELRRDVKQKDDEISSLNNQLEEQINL